jgi:hypothetical protein
VLGGGRGGGRKGREGGERGGEGRGAWEEGRTCVRACVRACPLLGRRLTCPLLPNVTACWCRDRAGFKAAFPCTTHTHLFPPIHLLNIQSKAGMQKQAKQKIMQRERPAPCALRAASEERGDCVALQAGPTAPVARSCWLGPELGGGAEQAFKIASVSETR